MKLTINLCAFLPSVSKTDLMPFRTAPIDKWFHMAAYWDRNANEAGFFRDGLLVSYQALVNGSYLRGNDHAVYDIGLKRDDRKTFKGHLRDLMIIGEALTAEDLNSILTGESE